MDYAGIRCMGIEDDRITIQVPRFADWLETQENREDRIGEAANKVYENIPFAEWWTFRELDLFVSQEIAKWDRLQELLGEAWGEYVVALKDE